MSYRRLRDFKHVAILPVCWGIAAALWAFPLWEASAGSYTFLGRLVADVLSSAWDIRHLLGYVTSILEIAGIALALSYLRVPTWIYLAAPIPAAFYVIWGPLTSYGHVADLRENVMGFGLIASWSLYWIAWLAMTTFFALFLIARIRGAVVFNNDGLPQWAKNLRLAGGLSVVVALCLAPIIKPTLVYGKDYGKEDRSSCINNLRMLDGAKQQWGLEMHKNTNDVPMWQDIRRYLFHEPPKCPNGGTYSINRLNDAPTCSCGAKLPALP
ncbi:MAG: hypothetical protein C5B50_26515 [Verrucomicrobia bacterium]|nr:MAG: hypothetical protein C5B50_26515 [Verrucomicrobiota bacterium]